MESMNADFDVLTIGRSSNSFVFYDLEYLRKMIEPNFRILSLTERVRLYQNALLLERALYVVRAFRTVGWAT
jgi:hypothetical protein